MLDLSTRVPSSWQLLRMRGVRHYGLAIVTVAMAVGIKLLLNPWIESPFLLLLSAVMISAWYGGFGPGLLASGLSAVLSTYLFLTPKYSVLLSTWSDSIWLFCFLLEGVLISGLSHKLHQARDQAHAELAERQRAEQALAAALANERAARAQTEQALAMRDQFLVVAAHELKNPLTTMVGCAQLLQRQVTSDANLSEKSQGLIAAMSSQTRRLQRMAQALLDLSALQRGALTMTPSLLDLVPLLQTLIADLTLTLRGHRIVFASTADSVILEGDEARLEQVFSNLLSNALKYSPAGGSIYVQVATSDQHARIAIRDEGMGIPPDELGQLFTRFYRARNVQQRAIAGLGLGLSVVKDLVSLHHGEIAVESEVDVGTIVTVLLPLHALNRYEAPAVPL